MKKAVTLALTLALALGLTAGCAENGGGTQSPGAAQTSPEDANPTNIQTAENFTDEMKIPHAADISPEDGADSVERAGDHEDSPYFRHPDFYRMESTDTLTILTGFRTIQQSSEWSCGVACALMVLDWYGRTGDWNEETLAGLRHELTGELADYPGTTLRQAMDIFDGVGGFTYKTTLDEPEIWMEDVRSYLAQGQPVMVAWNDWGGHWQIIIGYDDMGAETEQDDVFIVADPYDTTDHNQDGYGIYPAERFLYNFSMYGAFPEAEGGSDMLYLAAWPAA